MIDACVHPCVATDAVLAARLPAAHRRQILAAPAASPQRLPIDRFASGTRLPTGEYPGSDQAVVLHQTLDAQGVDGAVLAPLGRGLVADLGLACAIDTATNAWLVEEWLEGTEGARVVGSIRVCPQSPADAVAEIERWAVHPRVVQVVVPLESPVAYGSELYLPVWRAAAEAGLPVAMLSDRSGGVLAPPTLAGNPQSGVEGQAQAALHGALQVASLVAHGVFERLPALRWVCLDGAYDFLETILWRLDKEWRSSRSDVPWVTRSPSRYVRDHVRSVVRYADGAVDVHARAAFIRRNGLAPTLMFGSGYPLWDVHRAEDALAGLEPEDRTWIAGDTARALYDGLPEAIA